MSGAGVAGTALAIIVGLGVAFVMFCFTVSAAIFLHDRLAPKIERSTNAIMKDLIGRKGGKYGRR